jgi:pimeloyl-ACP methyl ester carboxylesterase
MTQSTFVLVHGAWHAGWVWDALVPELNARGHQVPAPDLACEDPQAGVAEYAAAVTATLGGQSDAVVVGQSLGGLTIPLVPARLHVYLSAFVPQPGRALLDRPREAFGPGFGESRIRDEFERSLWPDPQRAAQDPQYPRAAAGLARRLRPQARRLSVEPSPVACMPTAPSAYIVCAPDYAIPPDWQRQVARTELGVEPIELDSGHSPMLSCPSELAEILERLAGSRGSSKQG